MDFALALQDWVVSHLLFYFPEQQWKEYHKPPRDFLAIYQERGQPVRSSPACPVLLLGSWDAYSAKESCL